MAEKWDDGRCDERGEISILWLFLQSGILNGVCGKETMGDNEEYNFYQDRCLGSV